MSSVHDIEVTNGFTLIELLIVIVIIATLCALLMSSVLKAKGVSQGVACMSNLRQISNAMNLYRADHNNSYPMSWDPSTGLVWSQALTGSAQGVIYIDSSVLKCPALNGATGNSYGMTCLQLWYPSMQRTDAIPNFFTQLLLKPAEWPLIMDADNIVVYGLDNPIASAASDSRFAARHVGSANVLMADGHVEHAQYGNTNWTQSNLNNNNDY